MDVSRAMYKELLMANKPAMVELGGGITDKSREKIVDIISTAVLSLELYKVKRWKRDAYGDEALVEVPEIPNWGDDTTDDIFGGLMLLSKRGKMPKRIKANLFKNYGIRLPDEEISAIGNYVSSVVKPLGKWSYMFTNDINDHIGYYGDRSSCFRGGYSYHADALIYDEDSCMLLIFDKDDEPYARTWVKWIDGALVLFNAYSKGHLGQLRTRQIAEIVSAGMFNGNVEPRKVAYRTDVYQNVNWAIAIGGDDDSYEFYYDPEPTLYCEDCSEAMTEDDAYYVENHGQVCQFCLDDHYAYCEFCDNYVYCEDTEETTSGDYVCNWCAQDHYTLCVNCGLWEINDTVQHLNGLDFCPECYGNVAVECSVCGSIVHEDDIENEMCMDCVENENEED